jgi:hypothetical protein
MSGTSRQTSAPAPIRVWARLILRFMGSSSRFVL